MPFSAQCPFPTSCHARGSRPTRARPPPRSHRCRSLTYLAQPCSQLHLGRPKGTQFFHVFKHNSYKKAVRICLRLHPPATATDIDPSSASTAVSMCVKMLGKMRIYGIVIDFDRVSKNATYLRKRTRMTRIQSNFTRVSRSWTFEAPLCSLRAAAHSLLRK